MKEKQNRKNNKKMYITYGLLGMFLVLCVAVTGNYGLSEVNRNAYASYISESNYMSEIGFKDFNPADYKVRFFDGEKDYVVQSERKIVKEKKVFDALAATAWKVGDEYQVLVPVYENMSGFTETVAKIGAIHSSVEQDEVVDEVEFSEELYVSSICHEAFHVWQFNNFEKEMEADLGKAEWNREEIITSEIDSNSQYVASIEREVKLLFDAYYETDKNKKFELINSVLQEEASRRGTMSDNAVKMEYFIENLEGSAQYVEALVYRELTSQKDFEDYYLGEFEYANGSYKYYTIGLMKCLILDQIQEGWQAEFTYENGLSQIMKGIAAK